MYTKYSKTDLIVNSYISELSLKKSASYFGYSEVEGEAEMQSSSEMVAAMVKLPKYDDIRSRIRNASGIVNFITSNEYAPLVEFLLKTALPPTNNDIFNRGFAATLPSDYSIDARHFAGTTENPSPAAEISLDQIIRGTRKKMTMDWVKKQGWDIDDIDGYITHNINNNGVVAPIPESIKDTITDYEKALNLLKKDNLVRIINTLWSELQKDNDARFEIKQLEGKTDEKSKSRITELQEFVLSGEERKTKTEQLIRNRNAYKIKEIVIQNDTRFQLLEIKEDFSGGTPEYEENGFMKWNPISRIRDSYNSIIVVSEELSKQNREEINTETKTRIHNFIQFLSEYRTSDRELMGYRNKVLERLGTDQNKYVQNYNNEEIRITSLMTAFLDKGKQHGKVLIFSNVENSGLVKRKDDEGTTTLTLNDSNGIFSDFSDMNDVNESRDIQDKLSNRGKRTIVLVSSFPIGGLPKGASVVRIDSSPVDEQEARIIVDFLIEPYVSRATTSAEIKRYHDIAEKFKGKLDADSRMQEERENDAVPTEVEKIKDSLAYISPEGRETLEQLIFQMGQKDAIATIKGTLASNAKFIKNPDGVLTNIQFNEQAIVKKMIEDSNRRKTEGRLGLVCRTPKVKFDQYITKKNSAWGKIVGNLGVTIRDCEVKNREISDIRKKIIGIEIELMNPKLSTQTRSEKIKLKDSMEEALERLYLLKNGYLKEIPHFTVLYGKPGVGKSVWADALADICKFMIYNVVIGQVKSKWVGETSKFTGEMLNTIFAARNAVFLLDEIDRMMEMGEGSQGTGSDGGRAHETTKDIVSQFLARFEDDRRLLIDRNVFVIMTSNNLSAIDSALLSRTRGNVKQVEASNDPADYLRFLQTFLETEKRDVPNDPWIKDVGRNIEEQWAYTFDFFKKNLNLQPIAEEFARRELGFRDISGLVKELCRNHNIWRVGRGEIERGETTDVHGLPLTTENMARAARLTVDTSGGNAEAKSGVDQVILETSMRVEKRLKEGKLVEVVDPATGKKTFQIPEDVMKTLEGKDEEEPEDQYIVEQDEAGSGKRLQKVPSKPTPEQGKKPSIKDMDSTGFTDVSKPEQPVGEVPQEVSPPTDKQKKKEKEPAGKKSTIEANSTDYLYNFLKKAQIVDEEGKLKSEKDRLERERIEKEELEKSLKRQPVIPKDGKAAQSYDAELEKRGVYFCNNNQILIAPVDPDIPVQRLDFSKKQ